MCNVLWNSRLRNFNEYFNEPMNAKRWKLRSVFFGDFYLLSPFPHPSPAFPLPKQPQNCQLYHNFYLLHWRVTPPPSICLVLVQYGLLVEERIYLNISRVIICNIPTRQFLSSGQVSAMLVSLRVKHRRWDAHTDCGQKHLCEYNENILVDLNYQSIVNLGSYSQGVWIVHESCPKQMKLPFEPCHRCQR